MNQISRKSDVDSREFRLYVKELSSIPLLSQTEEKALGTRIKRGEQEAVAELVKGNLRFVIKIAKEYSGRGVPFMDLINEGNIGLIHAAWRFDPTRNVKFITYAVWWIRESLSHALASFSGPLQFPPGLYRTLRKIDAVVRKKTSENGKIPKLEEVALDLGFDVNKLSSILRFGKYTYSNHAKRSGTNTAELTCILRASGFETDPFKQILHQQIRNVLSELNHQEERVIRLRYGIEDELTLQQIGNHLGLSRERVRQIELSALKKCKYKLTSTA